MEKIQLKHPDGKKAISMDRDKFDILKTFFLKNIGVRKVAPFGVLLADVTADLKNENIQIKGVVKWNLFWVTLDMEARKELKKDKSASPHRYSI
jgi:hypothetical protein